MVLALTHDENTEDRVLFVEVENFHFRMNANVIDWSMMKGKVSAKALDDNHPGLALEEEVYGMEWDNLQRHTSQQEGCTELEYVILGARSYFERVAR